MKQRCCRYICESNQSDSKSRNAVFYSDAFCCSAGRQVECALVIRSVPNSGANAGRHASWTCTIAQPQV